VKGLRLLAFTAALAALAALAAPAATQVRQEGATVLMSEHEGARKFQEKWGFSDAVIAGGDIYLSGIVAGTGPGETGTEAAYERVYAQIGAVLKRAGASWDDVVDMTSFHTDVEGQIEHMVTAQKKWVKSPPPAWTAIGVSKILGGGITEIKITARRASSAAAAAK
jgi:enamine deaminase RidA (YjgF/YER057c/UK114 family)